MLNTRSVRNDQRPFCDASMSMKKPTRASWAHFQLMLALHVHEVVDDVEIVLSLEAAGRRRSERGARVALLGCQRLVRGVLQQLEPVFPCCVAGDDELVLPAVDAQL